MVGGRGVRRFVRRYTVDESMLEMSLCINWIVGVRVWRWSSFECLRRFRNEVLRVWIVRERKEIEG